MNTMLCPTASYGVLPSCILWMSEARREDCMPTDIVITNTDCTVDEIRALADTCKDANRFRRLRAVAQVMEGTLRNLKLPGSPGSVLIRRTMGSTGTMWKGRMV